MADKSMQLVIGVDIKDVNAAINKTKVLENQVKRIVDAHRSGKIDIEKYNRGLLQTKRAYDSISPSSQKATAEVRKLAKEFNRAYDTQEQVANLKRLEAEQTRAFAAARREATLINQQKIMEAKAAAKAVSDAAKQEVAAFRAARKEAELMNKQFDMERAASGLMKSQKAAKRFQLGVQQAGYQVGDFAVQVASGTNPLVAFSQQATQLVGFFGGPWGAAVGAGIAILSGLGLAFMNVNGLGKTTKEVLEDIKETIDGFSSVSDSLEKALVSPIDNSNKALVSYLKNLKAAKAEETLKAVSGGIGTILKPYIEMQAESEGRVRGKGRNTLRGDQLETELARIKIAKQINETLADATTGPAEDLGQNLLKAMESLRTSGLLTEDLEAGLTDLLETTGLRAQAEKDLIALVKEQTEAQQKAEKIKDEAFQKRTQQNILENEITSGLKSQIAYQAIVAKYGENSVKGKQELAKLARAEYEQEKYASGLRVEQVDTLMEVYDELIKVTGEAEAFTSETELTRQKLLEIDNIIKGIRGSISSLEMSAIGDAARLAALKAGKSIEESRLAGQVANQQALFDAASVSSLPDGARRAAEEAHQRQIELLRQQGATAVEIKALEDKLRESQKKGKEDPAIKMLEEISRRKVLIGLTEEQAKRQELVYQTEDKLGEFREKYGNDFVNNIVNQTMALDEQQKVLDEAKAKQKEVGDLISSSMEDAFMSIVDGTKSVKDAFKSMAASIISELYRIFVVKKIVGGITGFLGFADGGVFSGGNVVPSAKGNIFSGGNVIPFAKGGVVGSPMTFPMTGGKTGLMGEAGPEAIMPLKRGKGGKLGVVAENNGNVVIHQNFNFSANGDESVKKIIAQAAPQIAQMTKTSIINDRRRGGSTLAAFGR
jgi:phage-related minor tail protein